MMTISARATLVMLVRCCVPACIPGRYVHGDLVVYFREHAVTRQHDRLADQRWVVVAPGVPLHHILQSPACVVVDCG